MTENDKQDLVAENYRLQLAVEEALAANRQMARKLEALQLENERLTERTREAQNQMRLMRSSASWRLGGGVRLARSSAGKFARNMRDLISGGKP